MTRSDRQSGSWAWGLAWAAFALAIPLRLWFFAGYGLGLDALARLMAARSGSPTQPTSP